MGRDACRNPQRTVARNRFLFGLAPIICGLVFTTTAVGFQTEAIRDAIAAGEFSNAISVAQSLPAEKANQWLGKIANEQLAVGARDAAISTSRLITDDIVRSDALSNFYRQRSGGSGDSYRSGGSGADESGIIPGGADSLPGGVGNRGGITINDFQSLIDLIQSTIDTDGWDITNGDGTIFPYASGVYVDSSGQMKRIKEVKTQALDRLRKSALADSGNRSAGVDSQLRKISLTRLEREAQLRAAMGLEPTEEMKNLAGITEITYLMFFPETNDVVIAGPAGPWKRGIENRVVSESTEQPVLQLDDLVVCLRNAFYEGGKFGCTISPRQENLAETKKFVSSSILKGNRWPNELRQLLGMQDVDVFGIDRRTHAGRVIVEADYRMKLLGMGLEPTIPSVPSYLQRIEIEKDGTPPPMDVVRWWFTMNYDDIISDADGQTFQLKGSGVKVLSETEMIDDIGQRIHTGTSQGPTREFAKDFTKHFDELATEYPIYRQLKNVFDLALISSIIRQQNMDEKAGWHLTFFGKRNSERTLVYRPTVEHAVKEVDSVMNHRVIRFTKGAKKYDTTIVGVSGGVSFDARRAIAKHGIDVETSKTLATENRDSKPGQIGSTHWWWD